MTKLLTTLSGHPTRSTLVTDDAELAELTAELDAAGVRYCVSTL